MGGEVVHRVHPPEQVGEQIAVTHVALEEVGPGNHVGGLTPLVDRRDQCVEDYDLVAEG